MKATSAPSPLLRALLRDVVPPPESPVCDLLQVGLVDKSLISPVDKASLSQVDKLTSDSSSVDKIPPNSDSVVTALPQPAAPVQPMKSYADQITDLIAARPGIVNAEIADELSLFPGDIRPMLQPRIENSRIIVDKIQGAVGLINAYRINPKWKPSDAKFKPVKRDPEDDSAETGIVPKQRPGRQAKAAPVKKTKRPVARATANPGTAKSSGGKSSGKTADSPAPATIGSNVPKILQPADEEKPHGAVVCEDSLQKSPQNIPENIPPRCDFAAGDDATVFACAVYDNGALRIEHAGVVLVLTPEQTSRAVAHLSRFYPEIKS